MSGNFWGRIKRSKYRFALQNGMLDLLMRPILLPPPREGEPYSPHLAEEQSSPALAQGQQRWIWGFLQPTRGSSTLCEVGDRGHFWRPWSLQLLVSLLKSCPPAASAAHPNSWGCGKDETRSRLPRGVRPRLEGKQRTALSSRAPTRISWSPLSRLKGTPVLLPGKSYGRRSLVGCSPRGRGR